MKKDSILLVFINLLTLIRFIGAILLYYIYLSYGSNLTAIICIALYLTDALDGYLARKFKLYTFFGAIFDVISDKLLNIAAFIVLISITNLAIIPLLFEIFILIFTYIVKNMKSSIVGKIKMIILGITVISIFFLNSYNINISIVYFIPIIILELITVIGYIKEFSKPKENIKPLNIAYVPMNEMLKNLFNTKFYEKYKDYDGITGKSK